MFYIKHLLHSIVCSMFALHLYAMPNHAVIPHTQQQHQKIVALLEMGKVIKKEPMGAVLDCQGKKKDFSSAVLLVTLDNGLKAVFKPVWGACAEVAAYQAALTLGFPYIPPTIMRTIGYAKGALQLFIETPIDPLAPGAYSQAIKEVAPEDLANLGIFYFVFGHCDVCPGNLLITKYQGKTSLIAINNESIRYMQHAQYGALPFTRRARSNRLHTNDWDKPFPFNQAVEIKDNPSKALKDKFGSLFSEQFYSSIKKWKRLRYVVYHNAIWLQDGRYTAWPCAKDCPKETKEALEKLNLNQLEEIFSVAIEEKEVDFVTNAYLNAILERRDQVLNYYANHT
ncbi:MAG: hypothetical protein NMK33_04030 [Candidatus Cardinium sp.]|uniref:hypothetical protein n=1 Tax=Cardinium endosymbiont of Dermatophagoides farinae TaxID=2597823 RepID=UPI001184008B|nr:hypothetical protein [Cardinium endosymbiont of Dermatophagoides farinae]TSJ80607.1 hypothetical protein FPG78_00755 [Cardinium endosymbiont of Dermatophagoides farinae]UWW96600.1 MAG: hypothetical protein NMK33_04030 [Candidatus Cardinium sp.]